jgi:predicted nucleic acid-binding protein
VSPAELVYVLDSYALLAYLNAETGQERVQEILVLAQAGPVCALLCTISLGEVLYITERRRGLNQARRVLALLESLPLTIREATRSLVLDAAHIKAQYTISYADAFVAALAQNEGAIVLTGDPEFESVAAIVQIEWLV